MCSYLSWTNRNQIFFLFLKSYWGILLLSTCIRHIYGYSAYKYKQVGILYRFKARRIKINSAKVSEKSVKGLSPRITVDRVGWLTSREWFRKGLLTLMTTSPEVLWTQVTITGNNPLWNYPRPGLSDQKISSHLAQPSRTSRAVHTKT